MKDDQELPLECGIALVSGKRYSAPELREFGQVGKLTQAGTGTATEQNPGQGAKTKRP
jgi:hypothetical protein